MKAVAEIPAIRAVDTPERADVRALDGPLDEMFPLLTAKQVGELIGYSAAYVHQLWESGQLPYVLWPVGTGGRGDPEKEGRRRRMRADHLREAVRGFTQD